MESKSEASVSCRTCLKTVESGVSLYDVYDNNGELVKYQALLQECTGIEAREEDGLPTSLCEVCCIKLPQAWTFLALCRHSDTLLRRGAQGEIKVEVKEEEEAEEGIKQEEEGSGGEGDGGIEGEESEGDDEYIRDIIRERRGRGRRGKGKKKKKEVVLEWECKECSHVAETECRLKKHYKKVHPTVDYTYPCGECGKVFKRKTDLRIHRRTHTGERPYRCEWCGLGFSQWGTLDHHKNIHTGLKPYSCKVCGGRFSSNTSLSRHVLTHTGEKRHVCDMCGKKFLCVTTLRAHQAVHSTHRPHTCPVCGKAFKSRLAMRNHKMTHGEKSFVCDQCGKEFYVKANLSKHVKKMHSEGAGTCPVCHKATSDLKEHAAIHSEELNYQCQVCQRSFRHKGILNSHMASHRNAHKYRCEVEGCHKTFYRRNILEFHHNKVHAQATPHSCPHCPQGFYRVSDLSRHINSFHPTEKGLNK